MGSSLQLEYGVNGNNSSFRCLLRGTPVTLGRATQQMEDAAEALSLFKFSDGFPLGSSVGSELGCHIGGPIDSCSAIAAKVEFDAGTFYLSVCNDSDMVTLNGQQLNSAMGKVGLSNEDICGIGAR